MKYMFTFAETLLLNSWGVTTTGELNRHLSPISLWEVFNYGRPRWVMLAQLFHFVIGQKWKEKNLFPPLSVAPLVSFFACGSNLGIPRKDQGYPGWNWGDLARPGELFLPTSVFPHMQEKRETTAAHSHSYHANFCVGENPQHFAFRIASERGSIHISHLHRSERMFGRKAECSRG